MSDYTVKYTGKNIAAAMQFFDEETADIVEVETDEWTATYKRSHKWMSKNEPNTYVYNLIGVEVKRCTP